MTKVDQLVQHLGISAEDAAAILAQLQSYMNLVVRWNKTINLVSRATVSQIWERHVLDCLQVFPHAPQGAVRWVDLGSGGGFPGIVVAILAQRLRPSLKVVLVESDLRKSVFLREVARQLNLSVEVLTQRIEQLTPQGADVVSARALAGLVELCQFAHRHLGPKGVAVFLKGGLADEEIKEAARVWSFDLKVVPSVTQEGSGVLLLKELRFGN